MREALDGVRVLEVGTMTPGKYAGYLLCGWGARSIRVERPEFSDQLSTEDLLLNRGKRSLTLNLRSEAGREALLKLAASSDVLMESYRPGVAQRLGFGYDAARAMNPEIVYCSLSGFGQQGSDALRPAYDLLFQAETGFCDLLARQGDTPSPPRAFLADSVSGLMAAFAVCAALRQKEATGQGTYIDLSIQESLFSLLSVSHGTVASDGESAGAKSEAWSRRPVYDIYRAADGEHFALAATRPESARTLLAHLGQPDLTETAMRPGAAGEKAAAFLREAFARKPAAMWVEELAALNIEVAAVNEPIQAYDLPQLKARGMIVESQHPLAGTLRQIGIPGVGEAVALAPAPAIGADSEAILAELGYDGDAIADLKRDGAIQRPA